MSFCNPNRPAGRGIPGRIRGNALNGLCESVVLEVKRVFDGCLRRTPVENAEITIETTGTPVPPLTFISCASNGNKGTVNDPQFIPIEGSTRRQIVNATIGLPIAVVFSDSTGAVFTGTGFISMPTSTVLCVPDFSVVPPMLEAVTAVTCFTGSWVSNMTFNINCCTIILLKLVVEVEMLFPTYGYAEFDECRDANDYACRGFFNTPFYPFGPRGGD